MSLYAQRGVLKQFLKELATKQDEYNSEEYSYKAITTQMGTTG
jgi:hypothetical protein